MEHKIVEQPNITIIIIKLISFTVINYINKLIMESQDYCYICYGETSDEAPFMEPNPCNCKGSIKIHWSCFSDYRRLSGRCGTCKEPYSMQVSTTGSLILTEGLIQKFISTKGKIIGIGPVRYGQKNGHWRIFYQTTGTIKEEGQYINNTVHGTWTRYYESGSIKAETRYDHGLRSGLFKSYHENGVLESEGSFKKNNKIGEWKIYYNSSVLKIIAKYNDKGEVIDTWKSFYESGQVEQICPYVDGQIHGYCKIYWPSGQLKACGAYHKGQIDRHWKYYYENGVLEREGPMLNGKQNGHWTHYYESGVVKAKGSYINGEKTGKWKEFADTKK